MTGQLEGKVALVTGGAQGIGRAIAECMSGAGAVVVVGDLLKPEGASFWVDLDVTSRQSIDNAIESIVDEHQRLDVVVNNAGIMFEEDIDGHGDDSWAKMLDVNLTGPFMVSRAAAPHLKTNAGNIVNIGSIEGFSRNPGHAAYSAAKAGVHGLTGALAVDLGPFGVRVNAVAPGWIDTALNASYVDNQPDPGEMRQQLAALHPIGRIGEPRDVGDVVVWLASDQARFVTGQVITVDGGRLSRPPLPSILF